ncbi:Forkhead associated (FHA) domain, binds pSer, pThr, pTyr [Candidatus Methanophagaceae archaeon]|nr:Forkhead associated (FHA) domain, binds pSer, pThr, pTyr [Methanophagales archaeon]
MLKNRLLILIISVVIILIALVVIATSEAATEWLLEQWTHIFWAIVFAIVAGVLIHYFQLKIAHKPKISQDTVTIESKAVLATLILPNDHEIRITEKETVFGREDFTGVVSVDNLLFIGRKHFKILRQNDGLYIQDLGTKNGTMLNGDALQQTESRKLKAGDNILVANVVEVNYVET